ncbi:MULTISPECIES: phosphoglycolate phosphatase [Mesorhizobium]|uniref:phosphoglycolate phosphatase n=1 Tax=Mesorhizobium denitrificans TaxID=2294114 RepID=A0A371X3T0_9HYPH|nr:MULTISPECIES: phosphoglycolate phosphatase [Mesorhizobium]RFC63885.1 phosphoglycolate phosphatase [Mesorhizobium denitrificans]
MSQQDGPEREPPYKALVFDLDGTLINSAPDIAAAVNKVLEAHGWPVQSVAFVEEFIGFGPRRLLHDLLAALDLPSDDRTVDKAVRDYLANYQQEPAQRTLFYPHVREDLQALHTAGLRLGICTNKPQELSLKVLEILGVAPFFEVVVGADTAPVCKPHPSHLLAVVEKMDLNGDSWAYVGDTKVDQATAEAAGAPFYAVSWGCGAELSVEPHRRLDRLIDLARNPDRDERT